jgi:spore germination protein GerM
MTICSIIAFSFLTLTACEKKDELSINNKQKEKDIVLSKGKTNLLDLDVYFNSSSKPNTVEITKESRVIKEDELLAETIVNELIKGPSVNSRLAPILPKESRVMSISIKDNIAYLNLSKEANTKMTPVEEEACLKGIVFSLEQLPTVKKVKIFIDNKDSKIWGDNFDLSKPLGKNDIESLKK